MCYPASEAKPDDCCCMFEWKAGEGLVLIEITGTFLAIPFLLKGSKGEQSASVQSAGIFNDIADEKMSEAIP